MHKILNASYCARFDDFDFLQAVAEAVPGTGVELGCYFDKPGFMENQAANAGRFAAYPMTLHGPFTDVECAAAPGTIERETMIETWKRAFDVYEQFNASSIVLHTHHMRDIPEEDKETLRDYAVDTILELAEIAQERKINLTVENVGHWVKNNTLFNEGQFIDMFHALPDSVGALLDVGHALINRWDITHVICALNTRIRSYHLHNNDGCGDSHRPMFEAGNRYSEAEMLNLLELTNKYSPDADWILEYAPGSHISRNLLVKDLSMLKMLNR